MHQKTSSRRKLSYFNRRLNTKIGHNVNILLKLLPSTTWKAKTKQKENRKKYEREKRKERHSLK